MLKDWDRNFWSKLQKKTWHNLKMDVDLLFFGTFVGLFLLDVSFEVPCCRELFSTYLTVLNFRYQTLALFLVLFKVCNSGEFFEAGIAR